MESETIIIENPNEKQKEFVRRLKKIQDDIKERYSEKKQDKPKGEK